MRILLTVACIPCGDTEYYGTSDPSDALTRAKRLADIFLASDPSCHCLRVEIYELCSRCDAHGQRTGKGGRKRRCRACHGGIVDDLLLTYVFREGHTPQDAGKRATLALAG